MRPILAGMHTILILALGAVMLIVVSILATGVVRMFRGGDPRQANRLMQQRVLWQFVALALFALLMLFSRK